MLGGPEAQLTRRGIHFQVAGGSLGWQVAVRCLINVNRRSDDWLGIHFFQVTGLGGQVSGAGVQVRVQVQENPGSEPSAEDPNLRPDGWDLRPEN